MSTTVVRVPFHVLFLALAACGRAPARPHSVLVVVCDSLAAKHVSSYGCERLTTPCFDRFADTGVRFQSAYAQSSWTLPSVASLFTSQEQERHGLRMLDGPDDRLDERVGTLAESFRAGGYRTVALMQTPVLGSKSGLARGFDAYKVLDFSPSSLDHALDLARAELADERVGQPLFLYLHVTPPHMPYSPPPPFRGRFSSALQPTGEVDGSIASARRIHKAGLAPEHPDVRYLEALYDDYVASIDSRIGALIDWARELAHRDNLLVLWSSDHGEAFMEHGSQGHNTTVNEEMLRVPLAVACFDASIEPRVVGEPVSLLDVAPTLVDLCGLTQPLPEARGSSLAALLLGRAEPPDERVLLFSSRYYEQHEERLQVAARKGVLKLIWSRESDEWRLYDLLADPEEHSDVYAEHPDVAQELRAEIESLCALRQSAAPGADRPPSARGRPSSEEERARLKALEQLGYTQD